VKRARGYPHWCLTPHRRILSPYGSSTDSVLTRIRDSGYRACLTTEGGRVTDPWLLSRFDAGKSAAVLLRDVARRPRRIRLFCIECRLHESRDASNANTAAPVMLCAVLMLLARCSLHCCNHTAGRVQREVHFGGLLRAHRRAVCLDGRIFIAEERSDQRFDSLTDPTPTIFADLRTNVSTLGSRSAGARA
jgi:hypothetical protein